MAKLSGSESPGRWIAVIGLVLWEACSVWRVRAASLTSLPCADTSLIEVAPSNNNGGQTWVLSGTTQNGPSSRGLYRFDLTGLPTNTLIRAAALVLAVTHQPVDGLANAPFGLFRMLQPWGEGNKESVVNPGQGLPASPGEATWLHRFFPTNSWAVPGGAAGVDFSAIESSFQFIYGVGESPYRFESTLEMVADVQTWVRRPESNFGWMLRCDEEGTIFTARRFGSREDTNAAPLLELDLLVPPWIERAERVGDQFNLIFLAQPGQSYEVQGRASAGSGSWQVLARVGPEHGPARVLVIDTTDSPQRFYRLCTY